MAKAWRLVALASFASLGGFLFGYDLGVIGGALLGITEDLGIAGPGSLAQSLVVGAFKLGAFFGTFYGGAAMLRYGRRATIALNSGFAAAGPVIMALSSNSTGLVVGRLVGGFGIGSCAIVVPVYLAEVAPTSHRGSMVQAYEVMLCLGVLTAMLVDWALDSVGEEGWRWMVGLPAIPAAALALALVVLPESPRWLVTRGKLDAARATLATLHGESDSSGSSGNNGSNGHANPRAVSCTCQGAPSPSVGEDGGAVEKLFVELLQDIELELAGVQARRLQSSGGPIGDEPSGGTDARGESEPLLPADLGAAQGVEMQRVLPCTGGAEKHPQGLPCEPDEEEGEQLPRSWGATEGKVEAQEGVSSATERQSLLGHSAHKGGFSPSHGQLPHLAGGERTFLHTLAAMLSDIVLVARGPERKAFAIALWLAFFDQANASSAIINFAPSLLVWQGVDGARVAMLLSASVSLTKTVGVLIGLALVDRLGRRPLLIWGSAGCALSMTAMTAAAAAGAMPPLLVGMCIFILFFSASWAGLFWVLISELFSMPSKSPACSAATALLFLIGSLTNMVFMVLVKMAGPFAFLPFALVAALSGWYVCLWVPETRACSVAEVQALLSEDKAIGQ